jgi:hypothetical protein
MKGRDRIALDYLEDIADHIEKARGFVENLTFEQFKDDDVLSPLRLGHRKRRASPATRCAEGGASAAHADPVGPRLLGPSAPLLTEVV